MRSTAKNSDEMEMEIRHGKRRAEMIFRWRLDVEREEQSRDETTPTPTRGTTTIITTTRGTPTTTRGTPTRGTPTRERRRQQQ